MKLSEKWLREFVASPLNTAELTHALTMAGLEVEAVTPLGGNLNEVYVGEILSAEPHPAADRLRVCQVDVGEEQPLQIVCGASNARARLKVVVAKIGAVLPNDLKIKAAKLRGVDSNGMICSATELKLAAEAVGIMELPDDAKVGTPFVEYLNLNDNIIDINLTPNRADCLSVYGIAREVKAITLAPLTELKIAAPKETLTKRVNVKLAAPKLCSRYLGRVAEVDLNCTTPLWLKERLKRSGMQAINIVVDILNYVMLELGQPLHAFDLAKISGDVTVRLSLPQEETVLLDGTKLTLAQDDLIIADQNGPIALAGIMGGANSAVSANTKTIFIESAFFASETIAVSAKRYRLHSEASHRFERGVDFNLPEFALARACELLAQFAAAKFGPVTAEVAANFLPTVSPIVLRKAKLISVLGQDFTDGKIVSILEQLNMAVKPLTNATWQITPPSYRFDIKEEIDLVEEIARIHGYERIPATTYSAKLKSTPQNFVKAKRRLQLLLADRNWHEVITYSFVEPKMQELLNPKQKALALANPIAADLALMRTNFWPGLLGAVIHNQNRQEKRLRFFETGLCFLPNEKNELEQKLCLGGVATGSAYPEQWGTPTRVLDFFDLKMDLMSVFETFIPSAHKRIQFKATEKPALHPKRSAAVYLDNKIIGIFGELHPEIRATLELLDATYLFHLELNFIMDAKITKYREISKFPAVTRDLAFVVAADLSWQEIKQKIAKAGSELLQDIKLFDIYQGNGVELGQKSLAVHLTFQHINRTFTDDEIENLVNKIVTVLIKDFNAKLRG